MKSIRLLAIFTGLCATMIAEEIRELFDAYWEFEMQSDPFSATSSGVDSYNHAVPDASAEARRARVERLREFRERLEQFDESSLSSSDRLSAQVLDHILRDDIALAAFESWRIPFVSDSGFHNVLGYVVSATPFRSESDYRSYLLRLEALPNYFEQNLQNIRTGLDTGFTQPRAIAKNVLASFEGQVVEDVEEHPYFRPFTKMPESIPDSVADALVEEGRRMISDKLMPAAKSLARFMRDEYFPRARESLGASELPNGEAYYDELVRYFTTLSDATPGSIHERGRNEVRRIRKEMGAILVELEYEGSFPDFLEFLRTDPQFYAKTPEELLKEAAWIAKETDGKLPAFFGKLPRQPYSVNPVPEELEKSYTGGRYSPAPPESSRGGQYWVNTYALDTRPLYQLPALSLHEGVPGHHLQIALAYEIEGVPEFRKQYYPHAYGEGWGLYAEKLGVEMGIYKTPYEHFGRLSYEMWRACRLVVDTGIHAFGWSRGQAVNYLKENTALSLHEIGTEVDRYIAWPGQALAYKMGELTLWDLRAQATRELGDKFDLRDFHDAVLEEGGLPLEVLRQRITEYIESML